MFKNQTQIVQGIGSLGYVAIDVENKVDMACAEQLQAFIQSKKSDKGCRLYYISYCRGSEVLGYIVFCHVGKK